MSKDSRPILLYFPRTGPDFLEPPFGLAALAATLRQAGFPVEIIDCRLEDHRRATERRLAGRTPLFFGVTAMTGPQIFHAIRVSERLKELFSAPVVWGGLHVTLAGEQAISEDYIDFILRGYADRTIVSLAEALSSGGDREVFRRIPGAVFKDNDGVYAHAELPSVDLVSLPEPAWDMLDMSPYVNRLYLKERTLYLSTSRGCDHCCAFCYSGPVHRRQWQGRTAEQVIAELRTLGERVSYDAVFFHDDNFSVDRARFKKVTEHLKQAGKKFVLSANCADVDDALLAALGSLGCIRLDFAVESGSPRILEKHNKGFDLEQVRRVVAGAARHGVPVNLSFMLGHPEETREDILQTLDLIDELRRSSARVQVLDLKLLTPYLGTPIHALCLREGLKDPASLEGWGDFYWNSRNLEWSPEPGLCQDLSFISLFALRFEHLHAKNPLLAWVYGLLHRLESWRWEKRAFAFPVELRAMHLFLKAYHRLMRYSEISFL
jgi:radical SAM superfamily enzyme YgiQ (UPF0313 family)